MTGLIFGLSITIFLISLQLFNYISVITAIAFWLGWLAHILFEVLK